MREIEQFERGELGWNELPAQARRFYLDNYPHESIMVGEDENGPVSVADAQYHAVGGTVLNGGGSDHVGKWGLVGDFLGAAGDAVGITDYAGLAAQKAAAEQATARGGTAGLNPQLAAALAETNTYLNDTGGPEYFNKDTLAAENADVLASRQGLRSAAANQNNAINSQSNYYNNVLNGNDAYSNRLASQASSAAGNAFGAAGTFGGARHQQAALRAASDTIGGQQANAAQNLGRLDYTSGADILGDVGQRVQDRDQATLNEEKKKYDYEQQRPLNTLSQQVALGQIAQAGQDSGITADVGGTNSGLNRSWIQNAGSAAGTAGVAALSGLLGFNKGGNVHNKPSLMKRRF